jgi:hypothetical protein
MKNFLVSVFFCSMLCSCGESNSQKSPQESPQESIQQEFWQEANLRPKSTSKFSPRKNVECYVIWSRVSGRSSLMSCVFIPDEYFQNLGESQPEEG